MSTVNSRVTGAGTWAQQRATAKSTLNDGPNVAMPRGPAHQSAGSALFLRSTLNHPIDTLASFSPHLAQPGFGFLRLVRQSRVTSTRDDKVLAQPCLAPRCTLHAARPESGSDWNWRTRNSQVQYEEPLLLGLIFDSNRRGLFPTLFPLLATPYPSSHLTLAYRHSPCLISMSRPLPQPPPLSTAAITSVTNLLPSTSIDFHIAS